MSIEWSNDSLRSSPLSSICTFLIPSFSAFSFRFNSIPLFLSIVFYNICFDLLSALLVFLSFLSLFVNSLKHYFICIFCYDVCLLSIVIFILFTFLSLSWFALLNWCSDSIFLSPPLLPYLHFIYYNDISILISRITIASWDKCRDFISNLFVVYKIAPVIPSLLPFSFWYCWIIFNIFPVFGSFVFKVIFHLAFMLLFFLFFL